MARRMRARMDARSDPGMGPINDAQSAPRIDPRMDPVDHTRNDPINDIAISSLAEALHPVKVGSHGAAGAPAAAVGGLTGAADAEKVDSSSKGTSPWPEASTPGGKDALADDLADALADELADAGEEAGAIVSA